MARKREGITLHEAVDLTLRIQDYLNVRDYKTANALAEELTDRTLFEVQSARLGKSELSDLAGVAMNVNEMAPRY